MLNEAAKCKLFQYREEEKTTNKTMYKQCANRHYCHNCYFPRFQKRNIQTRLLLNVKTDQKLRWKTVTANATFSLSRSAHTQPPGQK